MANDWKEVSLGEIGRVVTGKTPKTKVIENFGHEIPFITPRDMDDQRIISETERYLSKVGSVSVKNSIIPANSISVSCIGSDMGKSAITKYLSVTNQQINSIVVSDEFYYKFVYYNLSSRKAEIRGLAGGSAQPILNKSDFSQIKMFVPPLSEQKAIAHILGSLDDKIELNRQMNETLEAMAQALFKSWFVDFDPVIDNALAAGNAIPDEFAERAEQRKGIEKKDNSDIQDLFPDEFEFTEDMGWIPKGWEVKNLTGIAEFQNGFAFYTTGYSESGYKVVDLANIHTDGRFIETHRDKHVSPEIYNLPKHEKHRLYKDDIVMAMTDITQAMGILGKCGKIYESDKYILNQRIGRIRIKEGININFLLTYLNSSYQLNFLKTRVLGTVQKYVNTTHIKEMNFVVPHSEVMDRFGNMVDPQFNKMREADEENETLAKLRDTLLPKLMSGEIRIPDAAALVDETL